MEHVKEGLIVFLVTLSAASAVLVRAQDNDWERANEAGVKAYQEGRYPEAERLLKVALKEAEQFGEQDPRLAKALSNVAGLYETQGKYAEAEPLYKRSLAIQEKALGPQHPNVAKILENYAALLRKLGRGAEAKKMEARAKAIRVKHAQENPAK